MQRNIDSTLEEYFRSGPSRPIMLRGMRGVGKTYTACSYASRFYSDSIYLNFETDGALRRCFEAASEDLDFIQILSRYLDSEFIPENILLIFDEITSCECAFSILRRFLVKDGKITAILINSLNLAYNDPEGIFVIFDMYPMTFDEFLVACGHEWYTEIIRAHFDGMRRIPELVHGELCDLYEEFLRTGGMPEVVADYIEHDSFHNTEELQKRIFLTQIGEDTAVEHSAFNDPSVKTGASDICLRSKQILSVLPEALCTRSGQFRFNMIRRGLTYKDCSDAIDRLEQLGRIIRTDRYLGSSDNGDILFAHDSFELRYSDHGILNMSLRALGMSEDCLRAQLLISSVLCASSAAGYKGLSIQQSSSNDRRYALYDRSRTLILTDIRLPEAKRRRVTELPQELSEIRRYILCEDNFEEHDDIMCIPYYAAYCIK